VIVIWGFVNFSSNVQFVLSVFGKTWPYIVLMGGKAQGGFLMLLGFAWLRMLVLRPEKRLAASDLRSLSSKRLRNYTVDLTQQLRKFSAEEDEKERGISDAEWRTMVEVIANEPERHRIWTENMAASTTRREAHAREYRTRFHGDAMALYDVLRERVGDLDNPPYGPPPMGIPPVLRSGLLAGVYPIQTAADYLDRMARRLP
jgi:hypothetical protein